MNSIRENIVPSWLLQCSYTTQCCNCNARFKPNILCIQGIPHNGSPPSHPDPNIKIQFIEFTYTNDQFANKRLQHKTTKYTSLLNKIQGNGWNVPPIIILTTGAKGTTNTPTLQILQEQLHLLLESIKKTLIQLHNISIQSLISITLYKRKLKHHQPLPLTYDPP